MAAKPADRIRTMINDLERAARSLGDDLRKRAGKAGVPSDLEEALRQLMTGLTNMAAQLEKAAGELRRFLEAGAPKKTARKSTKKAASKKPAAKKPAGAAKKATARHPDPIGKGRGPSSGQPRPRQENSTMKREFRTLVASMAICAVAFGASSAFAEEEAAAPEGPKTTGFYVGAGIGGATWDKFDDGTFTWRANLLYRVCRWFGAEIEWLDLGGAERTIAGVDVGPDVEGLNISAVPMIPIGDRATIFGKVGLYLWDVDYDNGQGESSEDLSFGLGGTYEIAAGLGLRAEWTRLMLDVSRENTLPFAGVDEDVDAFTVGAFFHF